MNLYFIALLPPEELRETITSVKEDFARRFGAKHALKSPPHITLQMPFKRSFEEEGRVILGLRELAGQLRKKPIELNGFGCFDPRVIFLDVKNPEPVRDYHQSVKSMLLNELGFETKEVSARFTPHLTIATRDLTPEMFSKAWTEIQNKEFRASFVADRLTLLRHNGKHWDVYQEFDFAE